MVSEEILKRAVIAGASAALKVQRKKKNVTEAKILEEVIKDVDSIVEKIDKE